MKTNGYIAAMAATLLFTSCYHEIHELASLSGEDEGLLGLTPQWEMAEDAGTAIHSLSVAVGGTASPFSKTYKDAYDAAEELIPLPSGKCDVLATVNLTDADGFAVSGMPATKADVAIGDVRVSLKNPVSSPAQAWFGVTDAEIRAQDITIAEPQLQRLLSTLSVNLSNVPTGTKLVLTLSNVAKSVNLTAKDATGRWGLPGDDAVGDLQIASLTAASDGSLGVESFTVLPTASAFDRCIITLDVTAASGNKTHCVCDAPHMVSGKAYTLELDFTALKPYMFLDSYSISVWEDGWSVNGEILNPNE